jgi:L-seryl-tRNA(Ser) seleniumtransferase
MTGKQLLRNIPKVDEILKQEEWKKLVSAYPEDLSKETLRNYLDDLRISIMGNQLNALPSLNEIIENTRKQVIESICPRLKRVINGTGVIIHTNLGRSLLAKSAIDAVINAAAHYTTLEYSLDMGARGDRYEHCSYILKKLTGAESALIVNNNAGAVFVVLNTLSYGKESVVSRGELVEIGGSFRVPDVMEKSGAILREVGTTNRTYREDYDRAISENTGLLIKIHKSNYRIKGFVHETTSEELISLGRRHNLPTFYDAGSGLLFPIKGIDVHDEPCIVQELKKGWDIISFSGDKLLGAPQAGLIIGEKSYIDAMKKNPITRAVRPDKFTLAALESTLLLYLDESAARREIPTLKMICEGQDVLKKRSNRIARALKRLSEKITVTPVSLFSGIGGGSLPDVSIPSYGVAIMTRMISVDSFEERLRAIEIPVIGRIEKDRFLIDMRTVLREEEGALLSGIETALME